MLPLLVIRTCNGFYSENLNTLIAGSLRIEIRGIRVVTPTTPPPPTTQPVPVFESPLVSWRELPALVDRYDHLTQIISNSVPDPRLSCDDGVTVCQDVVKNLLATATEETGVRGWDGGERFGGRAASWLGKQFSGTRNDIHEGHYWGGWLDNSIFIAERRYRFTSMGIRDTNPVIGVYRGDAVGEGGSRGYFELNYTSGAQEGQLSMTIKNLYACHPCVWSDIPVDDNGAFDNGIRPVRRLPLDDFETAPSQLTGRFYQGGEVGGVFAYKSGGINVYGAFGGKRSPDGP